LSHSRKDRVDDWRYPAVPVRWPAARRKPIAPPLRASPPPAGLRFPAGPNSPDASSARPAPARIHRSPAHAFDGAPASRICGAGCALTPTIRMRAHRPAAIAFVHQRASWREEPRTVLQLMQPPTGRRDRIYARSSSRRVHSTVKRDACSGSGCRSQPVHRGRNRRPGKRRRVPWVRFSTSTSRIDPHAIQASRERAL
jgi:hypothetical protein